MPDTLAPYLAFFDRHLYAVAFIVGVIDATGLPFPGRFLLVVAGALSAAGSDTTWVVLLAAAGSLVGDHVLYLLGWLGGDKVLSLYCRWTMGSARCVQKAEDYFRRFGGLTILIGRFVTGVRLFAAAMAGSGDIRYHRFVLFDAVGAILWASCFVLLGHFLGARAARVLEPFADAALGVGALLALAVVGFVAYRLWKRRRDGPAVMPSGQITSLHQSRRAGVDTTRRLR
jgi:membrane protein DedA with SNARE-associated domain